MPRASWTASDDLAIEVQDFQARYTPGETLQGHVVRRNHSDYKSRSVNLIFFGRTKTKFTSGGTTYRAAVVFFESVYRLHSTTRTGEASTDLDQAWPFRITIPTHPIPRDPGRPDRSDKLEPERGFLSNEGDISGDTLPGTFSCQDHYSDDEFVEYVLRAELRFAGEDSKTECMLPLNIQPPSTLVPIHNFTSTVARSRHNFIKSPKCLPENASKDMGFRDRLKAKMSSRTPQYAFKSTVIVPTVLQLHHPDPFSFKIYITPRFGKEMSNFGEGDPHGMPPTFFKSLKLKLVGRARYRAPSMFTATADETMIEHDFILPQEQQEMLVPILTSIQQPPDYRSATGTDPNEGQPPWSTLRASAACEVVDESKALDIGHLSRLKPHKVRPAYPSPSFMSYNIALSYSLDFKIHMQTVDEHHTMEGSVPITLLPPSEETQVMARSERAHHQPERNNDITEWQRMTGTRPAFNKTQRRHLNKLFGIADADEKQ
ncbi:uncharacterized protein HMPREF1541_03020 [Cyphellophora europaea CBS 101466]|uniref:Arrestin-like N-terminal domain-containing protein n=1 Tax=Cyphellophora europaea (strain CBS 101466) TaxID=1220924 RepID=W2RXN6_CYPE1|nr:uncharacterized protein HMPREF1541_03020 [Cyphellophora europaea CBS 101466]ETN41085.1 hypothetical protein HMPREF1541_03020 [Cyphellophora europaea CBS 101466]